MEPKIVHVKLGIEAFLRFYRACEQAGNDEDMKIGLGFMQDDPRTAVMCLEMRGEKLALQCQQAEQLAQVLGGILLVMPQAEDAPTAAALLRLLAEFLPRLRARQASLDAAGTA